MKHSVNPSKYWQPVLVLLIGLGIRIYKYFNVDFWYDEALQICECHRFGIHQWALHIIHPPLNNTLFYLWYSFSSHQIWLRLMPICIAGLTLVVIWRTGTLLLKRTAGLWAMILLAVMPMHVYYSRSIRPYNLLILLVLLSWYAFLNYEKTHQRRWIILLTVFCTGAIYTHYFALFPLAALGLAVVIRTIRNKRLFAAVGAMILAVIFYVPWIFKLIRATEIFMKDSQFFPPPVTFRYFVRVLMLTIAGYHNRLYPTLFAFAGVAILCVAALRESDGRRKLYLTCLTILPIVMVYCAGVILDYNYLIARYISFSTVAFALTAGIGLTQIKRKSAVLLAAMVLIPSLIGLHYLYLDDFGGLIRDQGVRPRKEYSEPADVIAARWQDGDIVTHACMSSYPPMYYYLQIVHGIPAGTVIDFNNIYRSWYERVWKIGEYLQYYRWSKPVDYKTVIQDKKRMWFIASEFDIGVKGTFDTDFMMQLRAHLLETYPLIEQWDFYGSPLYLFDLQTDAPSQAEPEVSPNSL